MSKLGATNNYHYALGRRKTAVATVRLFEGKEKSKINGRNVEELYTSKNHIAMLNQALRVAEVKDMYFEAKVVGGGKVAQAESVRHAIARALVKYDESLKSSLKKEGLLTRDPRMVERKKTGLKKARRAPQFSKR